MSISSKALSIFQRDLFLFVTNLVTGIVVARALGPAALGLWVILQLVPSYAEALVRLKFDAAAVYVLGRGTYRREDVLANINVMALLSSALVIAFILWQFDWLSGALFGEAALKIKPVLLFLLAQIPLQFLYLNYAYFHIASEDVATFNRIVLVRALTNSVLAIALMLIAHAGLWSVAIAAVASFAAGLLYAWVKVDRRSFGRPRIDWALMRELTRYGFHLYVAGLLVHLNTYGTRAVIVFFLTPIQIAFYGLAQGAGQLMDRVPDALGTILFPRISRSDTAESIAIATNAFRVTAIFLVPGGLTLAFLAEFLFTFLYGADYAPAARSLRILLPGVVVAGVSATLVQYFQGSGRADLVPKIQLGPVLVQLLAALILTRWWGLDGAALALAIGMTCTGALQVAVFLRSTGSRVRQLVPGRADVRQIRDLLVRSFIYRILPRAERSV
jgi:O-antigen/teichoic acid export membrane protein